MIKSIRYILKKDIKTNNQNEENNKKNSNNLEPNNIEINIYLNEKKLKQESESLKEKLNVFRKQLKLSKSTFF